MLIKVRGAKGLSGVINRSGQGHGLVSLVINYELCPPFWRAGPHPSTTPPPPAPPHHPQYHHHRHQGAAPPGGAVICSNGDGWPLTPEGALVSGRVNQLEMDSGIKLISPAAVFSF